MGALAVGLAWLVGIYLGSLSSAPAAALGGGAAFGLGLAALGWRRPAVRLGALCLVAVLAGALRLQTGLPTPGPDAISGYNDRGPVTFRAEVDAEPLTRDRWLELVVSAREVREGEQWLPASGRVLVRVSRWQSANYGDSLELIGKLNTPPEFDGFSYRSYLARQGIVATTYHPRLQVVASEGGFPPMRWVFALKARVAASLAQSLPEPEASLAQGILLGTRANMPDSLLEAFARTNTTHIIAISGFNIALVAGVLLYLFRYLLGERRAWLPAIAGVVLYTVFVGAAPSVVRAAIMGSIFILATHYGRQGDALVSLVWAAGLMAAHNPLILWDVGAQLSFLATAGLATILPALQGWWVRLPRWLGDDLAVTVAAQIAVLPVLMLNFHQFSLVTVVANFFALPAFPPIMLLGGLSAFLGLLWQPLGTLTGYPAWLFLTYMIRVVELFASLPFASLPLGPLSGGLVPLYYGGLLAALAWHQKAWSVPFTPPRWLTGRKALLALCLLAVLVWAGALSAAPPELRITFLDVGQGDAVLIRTPQGHNILVDGGPSPTAIANALGRRLPFWSRSIDLMVLTHPHDDHLAGLVEVLERYPVAQVLDSGYPHPTASYARFQEVARRKGVTYTRAQQGQVVPLAEGAEIQVLHPDPDRCSGPDNCSVVLRLAADGVVVLITGDLDAAGQADLAASGRLSPAQVLKVPHHGSAQALTPEFLAQVQPEVAVVSVGRNNPFGHPSPQTLSRLDQARVYRTDLNGTVEVVIAGGSYRVEPSR